MSPVLGANQKKALAKVGSHVDRLLDREVKLPSTEEAVAKLASKKFDYSGQPVLRANTNGSFSAL